MRQLKNITEQISIIETNREISAAILQNYLPAQNTQRLPALMGTRESKGFESEREILYSVLFDMRQEVAELKKMVHNDGGTCRTGGAGRTNGNGGYYSGSDGASTFGTCYHSHHAAHGLQRMMMTYKTRKNM